MTTAISLSQEPFNALNRLLYPCRTVINVKLLTHPISRTMGVITVLLLMATPQYGGASTSAQYKAQCYEEYHDSADVIIPSVDPQLSPQASQPHPAPLPVALPATRMPSTKVTLLGYTLYKGDLHSHPRGHCPDSCVGEPAPRRPMREVFQMAKMTGADFFAVTDHDISEISASNRGTEGPWKWFTEYEWWRGNKNSPLWLNAIDYNAAFVAADNATDGRFVGFVGYERTHDLYQHLNIFNMKPWVHDGGSLLGRGELSATLDSIVGRINEGNDPIIQFNHPTNSNLFNNYALKPVMADKTHLMEVKNEDELATFRQALRNGWKVSPVHTSDLHTAYGTRDHPGDFRQFAQRTGVALPKGQPLTKATLFAALRQRRTFSSNNQHLAAMYTANRAPMGSVLPGESPTPVVFNFVARETFTDRTSAEAQNICAIELWTSEHPAALQTWVNPATNAMFRLSYTMARPYFENYFYIVRAADVCDPGHPPHAESNLITAPIWTAAQYPRPVVTSPQTHHIEVEPGDAFTVQWSAPGVNMVRLQVSTLSGSLWGEPITKANSGQHTWTTAGWPLGSYKVTIADAEEFPDYTWGYREIVVTPPASCGSGQKCCEPTPAGGCDICVPLTVECP